MKIKARFYDLGRELGIGADELESIQQCYPQNFGQALNDTLLHWLRRNYECKRFGLPTWRRLVEAVDSCAGGSNSALAETIANKHQCPTGIIYCVL